MDIMGIKKLIGKQDDEVGAKKKAKTPKKAASCTDCANFTYYKNIDFEAEYFRQSAVDKGTIAFIMSPINFHSLEKKQWKHIICSHLVEYNVLFLPFPRCTANPLQQEKRAVSLTRSCKDNFIIKHLNAFSVDLIVLFDDTKDLIEIDDHKEMNFCGNWEKWNDTRVYLAKSLYSYETGGFHQENFLHTVKKINRFFNKELVWQRHPDFRRVNTLQSLQDLEADIAGQDMISIDVETSGLNVLAVDFRLKTVGICWGKGAACIGYEVEECLDLQYQAKVKEFVTKLLSDPGITKIAHNLQYEEKVFIAKWDFHNFVSCEDTMFLSYLFNEKRDSNGLKYLAGEYCDGYDKIVQDFAGATYEDLWFYNCMDTFFTYYLKAVTFDFDELGTLKDGIRYIYYEIMIPECYEIARMELDGVNVDFDYLEKLEVVLEGEIDEITELIESEYPATKGRNLNAPKQLADILYSILRFPIVKMTAGKNPTPSTDKVALVTLKELHGCKLAEYLLELKGKTKQLTTYVVPYLEDRPNMIGGRVRSSYSQVKRYDAGDGEAKGTVTGRLSSAGPNLQNISRDKSIKKIFVPSHKDRLFLQCDLSQAELRIAASLADEEKMLQVYRENGDLHTRTGLLIVPKSLYIKYVDSVGDQTVVDKLLAIGKGGTGDKKLLKDIRQNGKCFFAGTQILTTDGWQKVEDIIPEINSGFTTHYYGKLRTIDYTGKDSGVVATYFEKDVDRCVEFVLENGDTFSVTEDHKMVVRRGSSIVVCDAKDVLDTDEFIEC